MTSRRRSIRCITVMGSLLLCGCATGAMRIDVEVYKGPLAQSSDAQFASLIGYLEEAKRSLVENMNFTLATVANADFEKLGKGKCSRVYFKAVDVEGFLSNTPSETADPNSAQITPLAGDATCESPMAISMEGE